MFHRPTIVLVFCRSEQWKLERRSMEVVPYLFHYEPLGAVVGAIGTGHSSFLLIVLCFFAMRASAFPLRRFPSTCPLVSEPRIGMKKKNTTTLRVLASDCPDNPVTHAVRGLGDEDIVIWNAKWETKHHILLIGNDGRILRCYGCTGTDVMPGRDERRLHTHVSSRGCTSTPCCGLASICFQYPFSR